MVMFRKLERPALLSVLGKGHVGGTNHEQGRVLVLQVVA
jgi:hypothetical protein